MSNELSIAVCVPSIPLREQYRARALRSIEAQTRRPDELIVAVDHHRTGAAATRQRAIEEATSEWIAFLDDDDEFLPHHLFALEDAAIESDADMIYPWFTVVGGEDPFPGRFGQVFDPEALKRGQYIPITVLVRRQLLLDCGGFRTEINEHGWTNEDWLMWRELADARAKIVHLPERTWLWHHHSSNTSGNPARW